MAMAENPREKSAMSRCIADAGHDPRRLVLADLGPRLPHVLRPVHCIVLYITVCHTSIKKQTVDIFRFLGVKSERA